MGLGLLHPLDTFSVSLEKNSWTKLISTDTTSEFSKWAVNNIDLPKEYIGALISEGENWDIKILDWKEDYSIIPVRRIKHR